MTVPDGPLGTQPGGAARRPAGLRVRRIPDTGPRIISADEAWDGVAPYSQDALALDFCGPGEEDFARQPTRSSLLPSPEPVVTRIAQAVIEVVAGQRSAAQLIRHTAPTVYAMIARQSLVAARRQVPGARRPAVVRRVRICEPADGVVEACAVVVAHGRVRALAMRLEGLDGRWVVTVLTIG